ncbi:MAG: hypothetical protein ABSD92_07300 [Candidatus Bathyarchaeia archaeon]
MPSPISSQQDIASEVVLSRLDELEKLVRYLTEEKEKNSEIAERNEIIITKGQMNRAENVIEKWLSELSGNVIAELDYIDKTTFGYLDCVPKKCGIRIITSNPKEFDKYLNKVEKCSRDRPHFEIITIDKIHQRWIGSNDSFFIDIGADLKTDSLGHSTHAMRKLLPEFFREAANHFETLWANPESELKKTFGNDFSKRKIYPK